MTRLDRLRRALLPVDLVHQGVMRTDDARGARVEARRRAAVMLARRLESQALAAYVYGVRPNTLIDWKRRLGLDDGRARFVAMAARYRRPGQVRARRSDDRRLLERRAA